MKLKTILLGFFAISTLANAGFFDHDKAYYASHIEDAEEKIKSCKKEMAIARIDEDKDKVMALKKDQECKDAFDAVKEHKRKIREAEYAVREKERAEEKLKKEAQFKIDYKEQLVLQKALPYEDFFKIKKTCGLSFGAPTAECKVYKELKEKRKEQSMVSLISQHQGDALISYRKETCKKGSQSVDCMIAMDAERKDKEDTIARLSLSKEVLKPIFNECVKKVMPLRKKMKWNEIEKIETSFKCHTAMTAGRSFRVYGFSHLMK